MLVPVFRTAICRLFLTFALLLFGGFAQAQSLPPPGNVSALIYSKSAIELFWSPESGTKVEITRNGQDLGRSDARSLFQANLSTANQYNYSLRSVDALGRKSSAVIVSLTTNNFSLPIKRVYAIGGSSTAANPNQAASPPPPEPVSEPPVAPVVTVAVDDQPSTSSSASNIVQGGDNCIARNLNELQSCIRNVNAYRRIDLAQDISCGNNCCPGGGALLKLDGVQNLELAGHGHRLLRSTNQRQCSLLDINNASNISINDIRLDDDKRVGGCQVGDNCPRMVHIRRSNNINFDRAHISHGKGYAFYVQGTNGFKFENGSLLNSGVLGMYIGHGSDASRNIQITHSTFTDNQTNGLALLGVVGQSRSDNVVANNVFLRNHRRGQWAVLPRYGSGFTGGGQMYVAQATNVTVRDNIIKDGYCDNCFVQRTHRSGVTGIELGLPNRASVQQVDIIGNRVYNHDGFGISQNSNSRLSNVEIRNNQMLNTTNGEHINDATKSGNRELNTQYFESFEDGNVLGGRYTSTVNCSAGGAVTRHCGAESRFGQCAVQLRLREADCGDIRAELTGPRVSVNSGQSVVADGWVSNPTGRWCLVFRDSSGNKLGEQCRNLSDAGHSEVQAFVGLPSLDAKSPDGSRSVQLRVTHSRAGASMLLDDLKLSVGY